MDLLNITFEENFMPHGYTFSGNETEHEVENDDSAYFHKVLPFFFTLLLTEHLILLWKGKFPLHGFDDGNAFVGSSLTAELIAIGMRILGMIDYQLLYSIRFFDFNWSSPVTWCIVAVTVDLVYYYAHRKIHEIGFSWGHHQMHHSSEEHWCHATLRQTTLIRFMRFGFPQLLAILGVPLTAYIALKQFNLLFQFWLNSQFDHDLGPLGWVFNTPLYHKVHNDECSESNPDKNYGATLIIWDRIFGTFLKRKISFSEDDLVDSKPDVIHLKFLHSKEILKKTLSQDNGVGFIHILPSEWRPQTIGFDNLFRFRIHEYFNTYIAVHFFVVMYVQTAVATQSQVFEWYSVLAFSSSTVLILCNIGAILSHEWWASPLEIARNFAFIAILRHTSITGIPAADQIFMGYLYFSILVLSCQKFV